MSKTFTHLNEMLKRLIGWMIKQITLTFITGNSNRLYTKLYDNVMISTFTLSTFHSCQVTYRLALHMVFTIHSLSDMQDAAHVMMTLDITRNS